MDYTKGFINMCHELYDNIHGKEKIDSIFGNFNKEILDTLLFIYKTTFLQTHYYIKNYSKKREFLDEKYVEFYINSIQHFLSIYKIE